MRAAQTCSFNALLDGMCNALDGARSAARQRYETQLLAFVRAGMRTIGPLQAGVSVASLRAFHQTRVCSLSIEFDCMVRPCRKTSTLLLLLRKPRFWERQKIHRVLVELDSHETAAVRISIDGRVLKNIISSATVQAAPGGYVGPFAPQTHTSGQRTQTGSSR